MNPPAGRIEVGDRVTVQGRAGRVVSERLTVSNGAWRYEVQLDDGGTIEALDFEIRKAAA